MIEKLLGDISKTSFMEDYFFKLPFSLPGSAAELTQLGTWDVVESVMASSNPDVLIVKEGRRWPGDAVPSFSEARRLYEDGHTLLVRHAEKHHAGLQRLALEFENDFYASVDVHIYCTPGEQFGFGWHYDAEDVFILQTVGSKEYSLRKNTVNPWPLVETLPADMKYGREIMPLMKCLLKAGDWLYIPHGYWHKADAKENSISLAVGVMSTAAIDVFDFLRQRLLSSIRWRQRLPVSGDASPCGTDEVLKQYRALLAELGDDLAATLNNDSFARSFLLSQTMKFKGE